MAKEKKKGYPKIAQANWFGLRDKLKQRMPTELSASYVASVLGMAESSARANVVSPLKLFGLIGEDSKPTDLAYDWRDDSEYPEVCAQIISATYPQELQDLFHSPDAELTDLTSWFMRDAKVGEIAARMYSTTYLMLLQKKPEVAKDIIKATKPKPKTKPKARKEAVASKKTQNKEQVISASTTENKSDYEEKGSFLSPRLHIDIQVHISPESSPEQINKIFESMAKHLKDFKS